MGPSLAIVSEPAFSCWAWVRVASPEVCKGCVSGVLLGACWEGVGEVKGREGEVKGEGSRALSAWLPVMEPSMDCAAPLAESM